MAQPPRCQLHYADAKFLQRMASESTDGTMMASADRGPAETGELARDTLADPRWFPLRFNSETEEYHFALISPETPRGIAFLNDFKPAPLETRVLPRSAVAGAPLESAPLHLILHSGLGGSTFVARALAQPGIAVSLQEPPILTDVIAYGAKKRPIEVARLATEVAGLLARPFAAGEALVCKLSGVGNGLARMIAAGRPDSQLVCLYNPLDQMLAALASRGVGGRMAGRQLLLGLRNSRMMAFEMTDKQLLDHTDFQLAGFAWLSIQKIMIATAHELRPARVASMSSDAVMRDGAKAIAAVAAHLRLPLDVDACLASGVFSRHAKSGEPFDPKRRAEALEKALELHGEEIEAIVSWARRVAEVARIGWDPPYPLQIG